MAILEVPDGATFSGNRFFLAIRHDVSVNCSEAFAINHGRMTRPRRPHSSQDVRATLVANCSGFGRDYGLWIDALPLAGRPAISDPDEFSDGSATPWPRARRAVPQARGRGISRTRPALNRAISERRS